MKSNTIFIHIPKTGGTTINAAMQGTQWQTEPDFNYRHILLGNKYSNAGDIFNIDNFEKYKAYKTFMMLRHPLDRVTSEYYFIRERKTFLDLLQKKPTSFKSYINNRQTQNGVVNFLKGRRFYDIRMASQDDLDDILDAIDEIPIYVGIFEEFATSLQYFKENIPDLDWKPQIEVKRMTFKRPKAESLPQDIKDLILEKNALDLELYEYALEKFKKATTSVATPKLTFTKDKYNHIVPYALQTCLFEFCMEDKKYLKNNINYFKSLTFHYLRDKQVKDGRIFCKAFNQSYVNAVAKHYPNSEFAASVADVHQKHEEPLDATYHIAKSVDKFLKENKLNNHAYYMPMTFEHFEAVEPDTDNTKKVEQAPKKGFLSRFFGK